MGWAFRVRPALWESSRSTRARRVEGAIDWRQYALLATSIGVPVVLFALRMQRAVLAWVCVTLFIHLFDTTVLTNLYAGRIVGILFLPSLVGTAARWGKLPCLGWAVISLAYLAVLGVAFGFIWPWPDTTGYRPFTLQAPGRTLIYMARMLSDLSLTVFVLQQLRTSADLLFVARWMTYGATTSAFFGVVEMVIDVDFYYVVTGLKDYAVMTWRSRGISYEPRGLGLACDYALLALLIGQQRISKGWWWMLPLNLMGLLTTLSTSSIIMFAAGTCVAMMFLPIKVRMAAAAGVGGLVLSVGVAAILSPQLLEMGSSFFEDRLDSKARLDKNVVARNIFESVALKLEVFDASASLFLIDQPIYALVGTGPGLVSLPASDFIPPGLYTALWGADMGINNPPMHGPLLELSNGGVLGLACWIAMILSILASLNRMQRIAPTAEDRENWRFAYAYMLVAVVFTILQVSISPVWAVIVGFGAGGQLAQLRAIAAARQSRKSHAVNRPDSLTAPLPLKRAA